MTPISSLAVPERRGHFLLESGLHTDVWLMLDALFVDPARTAAFAAALADKLRPHSVSVVCGPLLGGAFLAQAVAAALGAEFYYTELVSNAADSGLYQAQYRLPRGLTVHARGKHVAVVDDVISAGSSTRATIAALTEAGASVGAIGALLVLGDAATTYFAAQGLAVETLAQRGFDLWQPDDCPLCRQGIALDDPQRPQTHP
ncbi:MAG: hypothetical protein J0I77_18115 [Rudaea sp.]|uniref:phosphoribosyltransferase family protein n=1 Tax=unclassified Rudaea TaxID=2627037 RepID=UPI0010F6E4DE|nr:MULTISPECIES: phosphoribosyltransferase family protein [unclassified Rudaea]MBN8887646.1 hypothetical protein [Rudaea sp.]MBR0344700.1 hypothetical protein [Rudaea sp.]